MYTAAFVYLIVLDMILKVNFHKFLPNALLERCSKLVPEYEISTAHKT